MQVAVLGTRRMGAAMARRLHQEGHMVHRCNRTASTAHEVGVGTVHLSPADAVGLTLELFGHAGSLTPVTEAAGELFARAAQTDGELDMSAVTRLFRSR